MERVVKKNITPKMIKKAIKLLKKYKVPKPHYVEVENPRESGDFLEGVKIPSQHINSIDVKPVYYFGEYKGENGKQIAKILYTQDIKNID